MLLLVHGVHGMLSAKDAKDFTQGDAADASTLTVVGEYKTALGPGPETGPVNRENGFRAINWDPAAASNAGVTQNTGVNSIFPVSATHSRSRPDVAMHLPQHASRAASLTDCVHMLAG